MSQSAPPAKRTLAVADQGAQTRNMHSPFDRRRAPSSGGEIGVMKSATKYLQDCTPTLVQLEAPATAPAACCLRGRAAVRLRAGSVLAPSSADPLTKPGSPRSHRSTLSPPPPP